MNSSRHHSRTITNSLQTPIVCLAIIAVLGITAAGCALTASTNTKSVPSATSVTTTPEAHDMAVMAGMNDEASMVTTDATSATADGFTLALDNPSLPAGPNTKLSFIIRTTTGEPLIDYQVEQTKKLHLIAIRSDLTSYQHLHPTLGNDGHWSVAVNVSNPGRWRIITDFTPITNSTAGARIALGADLNVPGNGTDSALPTPTTTVTTDGYNVTINAEGLTSGAASTIAFTITKDGAPVTVITPYLGSFGHLVAIRSADLGYLHIHPTLDAADANATTGPTVELEADVPTPGLHGLFLQFATASGVHTAPFAINVG